MPNKNLDLTAERDALYSYIAKLEDEVESLYKTIQSKEDIRRVVRLNRPTKKKIAELKKEARNIPVVGMGCNLHYHSDVQPYEVIRAISRKTIEVRSCIAERDPSWKPDFIPGGFSGHVVNQYEQKWSIKSDPEGDVVRLRLNKNGSWGKRYWLAEAPRKFHDFNF